MSAPADDVLSVDGVDVLRYRREQRDGESLADLAVPLASVDRAVPLLLAHLAGWQVAFDLRADPAGDALTDALLGAGASITRDGWICSRSLADPRPDPAWADPCLPDGLDLAPLVDPTPALVDVGRRAYPPGHPDHLPDPAAFAEELQMLLAGVELGEVLPGTVQVLREGRPVAAVVVNRFDGDPPYGGPWVTEVFRDPDPALAGIGALLLGRACVLLATQGETSLGLAVTHGNPALSVYRRLGFEVVVRARRIRLPALT